MLPLSLHAFRVGWITTRLPRTIVYLIDDLGVPTDADLPDSLYLISHTSRIPNSCIINTFADRRCSILIIMSPTRLRFCLKYEGKHGRQSYTIIR